MTETDLTELIEGANGFAAVVLAAAAEFCPDPRTPDALAVLVAGAELARWRLLEQDTPASEHARAIAVDIFEHAATNEIAAFDLETIDALVAEWAEHDNKRNEPL